MPLTPIWALFGASCVCLLFGNANVNAERDKIQSGQDIQDGEQPSRPRKPPKFPLIGNKYRFQIVNKGGVPYYDLAGVDETELKILSNVQKVKGITASHGECKVRSLYLGGSYILDEDLLTNCPQLNLTLTDNKWRCVQEGLMLQRRGVAVDMSKANCKDVWFEDKNVENQENYTYARRYSMDQGIQKLMEFNITSCSDGRCTCKWYFKEESYTVNADCGNLGLTDDMLPTLPNKIQVLRLEKNKLRSMDKLIEHLLPHNQTLIVLHLNNNLMEELPHFPNGTFPHIIDVSLINNKIEKIDIEAFKELITRKELVVSLEGNTFPCDCVLYRFKTFLQENYLRHWRAFNSLMNMECKYKGENKTAQMHTLPEEICKTWLDWWEESHWWGLLNLTLCSLNILVIILIVDLICIVKHIGWKKERVPLMDRVLGLFRVKQEREVTTSEDLDWETSVMRRRALL